MLVSSPIGGCVGQRAIDGRIPIGQGIHPIVRGPLPTEVDLEGIWIQGVVGSVVNSPRYGEKVLVIDHMVLGGDIIGAEVAHKTDGRRMLTGEAQKLSQPCARGPFGDFVSVLEFWV